MIAVETLRCLLVADLEHVAGAVLSRIQVRAGELRGTDRHGDKWALQLRGGKRGVALNLSTMQGANPFDFLSAATGSQGVPATCRIAEALLGLAESDPKLHARIERDARERQQEADRAREREEQRRSEDQAQRAHEWRIAPPVGSDTPAAHYLAGRACLADDLHPYVRCAVSGRGSTMLAALIEPATGRRRAYHETAISLTDGAWRKRRGKAKLVWGPAGGCLIPLAAAVPAEGGTLLLAEGIENGLTAHLLLPGVAAAAAYSVGNLRALDLAPKWTRIVLVRDRETNPRSHGPSCRAAAILRWWGEGRAVTCLDPPDGFADLNDAAQARGGQRNAAAPMPEPFALAEVPAALAWCRAHGLAAGEPHLLAAHHAIEAGGRTYPAVTAPLLTPDGATAGMVARLLPQEGEELVHPWREWGERAGAALALRPYAGGRARLGVGLEAALAGGAHWAALGLDHLAEAVLAPSLWALDLIGAPPAERWVDDVLLWREGLRRLHPGRELRIVDPSAQECGHAEAAA
ncbi:MAG TPA: toprim domain-containing protein [Casimicrobiaceae bacterium]|nr:toprim domain-containing protein [Casimicrobiaceae bacterium]